MGMIDIGGGNNAINTLPYFREGGLYDASKTYWPLTIVKYNDIAYKQISSVAIVGIAPDDTDNWEVFTESSGGGGSVSWSSITGKPTEFNASALKTVNIAATTPTANQFLRYNSGTSAWTPTTYTPDWSDIANKPSSFTPATHVHDTADVTTGTFVVARIPDLDVAKITSGTLSVSRGGTGLGAVGGANTIPGVNSGGTALEYKTLTQGANITITHAANSITIASTSTGTVTSVGLSLPAIFTVSNSSVTSSGTLTAVLANQLANLVLASPDGYTGAPAFRSLTAADIPSLSADKIGSGTLPIARGGTGNVTANAALNAFLPTQTSQAGKILSTDGTNTSWIAAGGAGTVTSVNASVAYVPELVVTGGPVTASGTLTFTKASQTANYFWGAPNGSAGAPVFRALVAADLPSHSHVKADISDFAHDHNSIYYTKTQLSTASSGNLVDWTNVFNEPAQFDANTLQTRAVASTSPTNGQVLTWDNGASAWTPATPSGTGDMLKSVYDANNDGIVTAAASVPWLGVTNAPATYAPSAFNVGLTLVLGRLTSTQVPDFTESVEDVIAAALTASASVSVTYNDGSNTITPAVITSGIVASSAGLSVSGNLISALYGTAMWNADKLQGTTISATSPTTGQVLAYNGSNWIPSSATDPSPAFVALTDGATVTWATGGSKVNNAYVQLGGARALTITGLVDGATGVLVVTQDGTGGRTLSLPSSGVTSKVVNTGSGAWTPTTGASKVDILSFVYRHSNTTLYWTVGKDYT